MSLGVASHATETLDEALQAVLEAAAQYARAPLTSDEGSPCSLAEDRFARLAEAVSRASFVRDWELRYRIIIPEPTPSNNVIKGMQRFAYRDLRRTWRDYVWVGLKGRLPKQPLSSARVVINRHCNGALDWDNAFGGLKVLFDCLVVPTDRNPDGLGLITDDNPVAMPEPPYLRQIKARRGKGFTECLIYAARR